MTRARVAAVTGHRPQGLEGADVERLEARVDEVLERLGRHGFGELASGLAEGADRIVAWRALAAEWAVHAVLPFEIGRYRQDFATEESRREFQMLLDRCVDIDEPAAGASVRAGGEEVAGAGIADASPAPYVAVGQRLNGRAEVLLAVWDGAGAKGPGGTGDVVAEARRRGTPVLWIDARPPHGVRLLEPGAEAATSEDESAGLAALVATALRHAPSRRDP